MIRIEAVFTGLAMDVTRSRRRRSNASRSAVAYVEPHVTRVVCPLASQVITRRRGDFPDGDFRGSQGLDFHEEAVIRALGLRESDRRAKEDMKTPHL